MAQEQLLPRISPEVTHAILAEMAGKPKDIYALEVIERLLVENPILAEFISKFSQKTSDSLNVLLCGILVVRLIESQIETEKLEQYLRV